MTEDKNQIATSYDWWSHAGSVSPMPPKIMLGSGKEPVMTIHPDGRITLGENAQPTEAAAECIDAMSHMIQSMIRSAVAAEIERLKYDGIHSCGDHCLRPLCVAWRENEKLLNLLRECDPESMSWLDARDAALEEKK